MFRRKSWNRIPAYKFGYGWKPIFKCFLSQRIKRIDLNTPIFFSVRDQFQKKIWEQDSNKCAIFRSTVFVLWCVGTLSIFKVSTNHSTNTVERNMVLVGISCIQILFWNWAFFQKYIGLFKSMRLILCERKRLNIGFHLYLKVYAGILFQIFFGTGPVQMEQVPRRKKPNPRNKCFVDLKSCYIL